ncbi:TetR/AcrR family transcriptional regulator [Rhodococcus qingshengii]|uniref:TetR/AcrR family transcriptional regulator n=1 Tax=Rhodococcus qingshengii TaxID=334542 RepID=UPI0010A5E1CC|nr:TetR family transcriptional regulator [Rhodococcus qingshengii]THJ67640.1 TetR/AcrR family transcriptional regulator [Rhodococcus qingshengii]
MSTNPSRPAAPRATPPIRIKDSALTRRRILDAAIREFSAAGLAGARVDRIAEGAGANKAMIYRYFGSKDQLFDAVFDAIVVATVDAVPMDAEDLPGYAIALLEQDRRQPDILRIATWDRLERDGAGKRLPSVVAATQTKIDAIRAAQDAGKLTTAFPPETVLSIVISLSQTPLGAIDTPQSSRWVEAAVQSVLRDHQPPP